MSKEIVVVDPALPELIEAELAIGVVSAFDRLFKEIENGTPSQFEQYYFPIRLGDRQTPPRRSK
jgi:small basic protein